MPEGKHSSWVSMHYHRAQPFLNHRMQILLAQMESSEEAVEFLARGRDVDPTAGLVDSALHAIRAAEEERARKTSSIQSWLSGADTRPEDSEGNFPDAYPAPECSGGRDSERAGGLERRAECLAHDGVDPLQGEDDSSSNRPERFQQDLSPGIGSVAGSCDAQRPNSVTRASAMAECRRASALEEECCLREGRTRSSPEKPRRDPPQSPLSAPAQRPYPSGGGWKSPSPGGRGGWRNYQSPDDDVVMRFANSEILNPEPQTLELEP